MEDASGNLVVSPPGLFHHQIAPAVEYDALVVLEYDALAMRLGACRELEVHSDEHVEIRLQLIAEHGDCSRLSLQAHRRQVPQRIPEVHARPEQGPVRVDAPPQLLRALVCLLFRSRGHSGKGSCEPLAQVNDCLLPF